MTEPQVRRTDTPRTEAGRRLAKWNHNHGGGYINETDIIAIEAEAAQGAAPLSYPGKNPGDWYSEEVARPLLCERYPDHFTEEHRRSHEGAAPRAEGPLFDPESEHCHMCGQPVGLVWTAPDDLWQAVTGITDGGGIRCVPCFDKAAEEQGRFIRWVPQQESPSEGAADEN